jgi:hypothetical protein
VFWAYWHAWQTGASTFAAYSPLTRQQYEVSCTSGATVVCRAADGGEVRFPLSAVRAYDADQAARYAATHETGPPSEAGGGSEGAPGQDSDCDPNYEGACLDPNAADYDCEGGSGDGPEYTGPVTVVGEDHFGLDRDGDGEACVS